MKKRGSKHHRTQKGAKVRVKLRDGSIIIGKFDEQSRKFCLLQGQPRIPWNRIESMSRWGPPRRRES